MIVDSSVRDKLSSIQQQIFDLHMEGKSFQQICKIIYPTGMNGRAPGLVQAQMTRMEKYGLKFDSAPEQLKLSSGKKDSIHAGTGSSDLIADDLRKSGKAVYNIQAAVQAALMAKGNLQTDLKKIPTDFKALEESQTVNNMNPMIILGCTIQFVKLCGGRMAAHSAIEEVFDALRLFSADNRS